MSDDAGDGMKITVNPQRAAQLVESLASVKSRIAAVSEREVRLVAVSKLKPASDILALHQESVGHKHFGENYVQELVEKAKLLPNTIRWHFIGGLQSNKCKELARDVDSLWAVESVDTVKKATLLDKGREERNQRLSSSDPLRVFIQVNTSGEESKSGVSPEAPELSSLAKHITGQCPHLHLQGVMTIGAIARSKATTPETENEDFVTLAAARDRLARDLDCPQSELDLSMGMSEDFEGAIRLGSDEVRIGSTIFGERPAKKDAKVVEDVETENK